MGGENTSSNNPKKGHSDRRKTNNVGLLKDAPTQDNKFMYAWTRIDLRIGV